jgi:hypothetical protein
LGKDLFPDYFLTYGDYFTELLTKQSVLFDKDKIITCGSYSTEKTLQEFKRKAVNEESEEKIIYVTSQWSIRDKLKLFVLELSDKIPVKYKIIYKTHPLETEVESFYSDFSFKNNIELMSDVKINSLELMPTAFVHSTAYSTSFMEAHFMGKPNIFIYIEGFSQVIESFIDDKTIYIAHSPEEYVKTLLTIEENQSKITSTLKQQKSKFYKPNAGENIKKTINRIIDESI